MKPPHRLFIFFLLFLALCFPLFLNLANLPLRLYDESRLAVNGLEMVQNGKWLVPHFDGQPDLWNTKPPLMIWLQALGMHLFGFNELAVRLPAALAGLATALLLFFYGKRTGWLFGGWMAALILVTTPGYVGEHVSRTGDCDALLVLWLTAGLLSFFHYVESSDPREKTKFLLLTGLFTALGVLTKSIVGFMFLPAMFAYLVLRKRVRATLTSPAFYLAALLTAAIIGAYYLAREYHNPTYLQTVWNNEIGGRYLQMLEGHGGNPGFYLGNLPERFSPWIFFLPIGVLATFLNKTRRWFWIYLGLHFGSFLLFISLSQTKLRWYDAPLFPILSLFTAVGTEWLWKAFDEYFSPRLSFPHKKNILLPMFILAIWGAPFVNRLEHATRTDIRDLDDTEAIAFGSFMKQLTHLRSYTIAHGNYNSHIDFYRQAYNNQGYHINSMPLDQLPAGERVLLCGEIQKKMIDSLYGYEILKRDTFCRFVRIEGPR
jgi:4-amino-4-deoxy-L-arabinose transferase-like glycosyltransferase